MKKVIFILFSVLVLSSCVSKSKYEDLEYENHLLERKISDLEDRIDELENKLSNAEDVIYEAKRTCFIWDDDTYMVLSVLNQY